MVDIAALSEADRDVFRGRNLGYIFQTHHLLPGFTALENVQLGMTFGGAKHDPQWARYLLTEVGLGDRLGYRPAKLSVGQQQRVAIARALGQPPQAGPGRRADRGAGPGHGPGRVGADPQALH